MVSQVGFGRRAVVWRTLIKTMRKCGDSTHRGVTKGVRRAQFPGCRTVADTGYFGGGDAISICNEPNASQDHFA